MIPKQMQDVDTCWHCGAHQPSSHVVIRDAQGTLVGRICASHTFYEIILDRGDGQHRMFVEITQVEDP